VVGSVLSGPPQDLDQLRKELGRRYRGEVEELDRELAGFMKSLRGCRLLEECLVVVLGGHGTDLCDRYPTIVTGGSGFTLRDEQLHVPLIIRSPKRFGWSRRVPTQVRLIDLAPTLCDLLSIPVSEQWQGASLAPAIRQEQDLDELPVFASACNLEPDRAAVRYHGRKYIRVLRPTEPRGRIFLEPLPSEQLYNVRQDPGETENLATPAPQRLADMQRMLLEHLKESQAERERLFPELPRPPEDASEEPPALKQPGKSTPISETAP
ncbi:MAG: sulfatase-like hydrolase/transferase, partial [Planctomycetes bacterium]|nr:sulfatase-like hydrolase/transferase [Planctomycetota bacterium]